MSPEEFDSCLIAYHELGNDYRYVFTREQVNEIKKALNKKSWVDEVRELLQEQEERESGLCRNSG